MTGSGADAQKRAVITGKDAPYNSVSDLRGKTIGVSRMGSGSQIFASYMALREKWFSDAQAQSVEPLDFKGKIAHYRCRKCADSLCSAGHFQGEALWILAHTSYFNQWNNCTGTS